ncbi:hypothetical protein Pcinc_024608 [Petrolisthes cinctipes]|uniref:Uncharacterized protein n=1 Tax=Petrolisthes cinctipes TaxID=88211 RepID=A0AAE1KCR3_PETCI|nr:hypothetical protein Pcinc_024608 [Petrolisthes cinctipes]
MAEEVHGKASGKKPRNGKESWWWCPNCKEKIEKKKEMKKAYDKERTEERKSMWKDSNKEAKKAVAQARAADMYEELEKKEGQKRIFKDANIFITHNIPLIVLVVTYTVYIIAVGDRIICGGWRTLEKKVVTAEVNFEPDQATNQQSSYE